ncbi:hypothetical protein H9Q16_09135 [Sulfitobacter sp. TSTF-M16]|uniref:Uncharacterized protein n=1 Tax=Sulfitobacter aestuariivivens TaxID=2766981 RepID=A0A927D2W4_9RHOB|nr:hypothetical protein [Sulfitobacter aestuariivivens]MBD3664083.1 hypothetical protein [Sulfitobacter aestuariivivens]
MMFFTNPPRIPRVRQRLAMVRQMTSLMEREMLTLSDDLVYERENWINAYIDYGNSASFDGNRTTAYRGVALADGTLFWLVRHKDKKYGYHSTEDDPLAAVEEAELAWQRRKEIRGQWDQVEALARDLLLGRRTFRVGIEDAYASPLCTMGVEAFLKRLRLQNIREVSGRFAAILMTFDAQVGFVIHQAFLRHANEQTEQIGGLQSHV